MAKATHAQEVSTGTSESFTEHELNDPEPHLALLRNRPGLRDEPAPVLDAPLVVAPEEVQDTVTELEEFETELEEELEETELDPEPEEEPEPEPKPAPRKVAKKTAPRRKSTDDYDFE